MVPHQFELLGTVRIHHPGVKVHLNFEEIFLYLYKMSFLTFFLMKRIKSLGPRERFPFCLENR
jgi:hypothetical protein